MCSCYTVSGGRDVHDGRNTKAPEAIYIKLSEVVERLGLSARTIRSFVHDPVDPLPAYRVGGKLLFRWMEVESWIERRRVEPGDVNEIANHLIERMSKDAT